MLGFWAHFKKCFSSLIVAGIGENTYYNEQEHDLRKCLFYLKNQNLVKTSKPQKIEEY